jgi:hypothetical protein
MLRLIAGIGLVLIAGSLIGWLSYRYFVIVPPTLIVASSVQPGGNLGADGEGVLTQADLKEMGSFASEPRFRGAVNTYLADLAEYRRLTWTTVTSVHDARPIEDAISKVLAARLKQFPQSQATLNLYPPKVIQSLAKAASLALARCAGMPGQEYIEQLGGGFVYHPASYPKVVNEYKGLFPGQIPPPENADQATWAKAFAKLDAAVRPFNASNDVVAFSTDALGFIAALHQVPTENASIPAFFLHFSCLTSKQIRYFEGDLYEGQLILTSPTGDGKARSPRLQAELDFIVKTRGSDCYPVLLFFLYDELHDRWNLFLADRCCSPRMINTAESVLF